MGHYEEGTMQCGHHCRDFIGKEIQKWNLKCSILLKQTEFLNEF